MVAGIVLVALGLKKTLEHTGEPLKIEVATALLGGVALYLLAHVAFRWRNVHRLSRQRLLAAAVAVLLIPVATEIDAITTLVLLVVVLVALIAYERVRFAELRDRLRHGAEAGPHGPASAAGQ
jgi:low temperature requirement protein LtrA